MSSFEFALSVAAHEYLEAIKVEMMEAFGIDEAEALGRINRHFRGQSVVDQADVDSLTSEVPEYWARRIYYGPDAKWWVEGESPKPVPYPDQ